MIVIPQGKKIIIIAVSLFVTTFSGVLYFIGGSGVADSTKASVLEGFFQHGDEYQPDLGSDAPMLAVASNGALLDTNEKFSAGFSYSTQDLASKSFFSLVAPDDLPRFAQDLATIAKDGKVIVNAGPYHLIGGSGEDHVALITFSLAKSGSETDRTIILTLKDITESVGSKKSTKPGTPIKDMQDRKNDTNRIIVEKTS